MKCLSHEELLQVALGEAAVEPPSEHLSECAACRAAVAEFQMLDQRLAAAHRSFGDAHETGRAQLLAALEQLASQDERREILNPDRGGLTVAQRTAIGGVALAAMLAGVLLWVGSPSRRASAMERMAENIRHAKSYYLTIDTEMKLPEKAGEDVAAKGILKRYWRAPGSVRMEESGVPADRFSPRTQIFPAEKPGIDIRTKQNVYFRMPARRGQESPLFLLDRLANYEGQANRDLGVKKIEGKPARGFEIDLKEIDPDAFHAKVEIWIDQDTNLPVHVHIATGGPMQQVMTMHDFHWNVNLDESLFDSTPPPGYKDATPRPARLEQQVERIKQSLSTYAEFSRGHYPRVKTIYGDVMNNEMLKMIGIDGAPSPQQTRSETYVKFTNATQGLGILTLLFRENPDVAYYGQTVEAKDKDKVLLRWQLDDGQYQVMYGDLHSETVSPERLRELEAK